MAKRSYAQDGVTFDVEITETQGDHHIGVTLTPRKVDSTEAKYHSPYGPAHTTLEMPEHRWVSLDEL